MRWIPSLRRCTFMATLGLLAMAVAAHAGTPPTDGWQVRFDARRTGLVDQGRLVLGASSQSQEGADDFDDPHPPALPSRFLDLFTEHHQNDPGWATQATDPQRYRAQYGAVVGAQNRTYTFLFEADQAGPVTLTWALFPDVDLAQHFLLLRDVATGATVDMWAASSYAFTASAGRREFQMELTTGRSAPPIAQSQTLNTNEDTALPVTLTALDPEGDPLTFTVASAPTHGALSGTAPNLVYLPASNYFGPDSFTFTARDPTAESNLATISIEVVPVNDAPVAQPQDVATDEDTPVAITLGATDVDGDALTFNVATPPAHGTVSGSGANVTYAPAPDYSGPDRFTFRANDGAANSVAALVTITVRPVNDPPVAEFTVPGVDRNAATWDNNVGSFFEGANIVAFSSQNNTSLVPANAIDDNVSSRWASAQGATTGQFLTLGLPGGRSHTVTAVRIVNADGTGGQSIKNFLVQVSNTTADDAAFTTVLTDAALDNNRVQEFVLSSPVEARYVKLVPIDNWGSTCCVGVKSFEVIERGLAGVPSHFVLPANAALASELGRIVSFSSQGNTTSLSAANLIDGNVSSRWSTLAPVRTGNVVVELGKGKTYLVDRVRLVNAAGTNTSVRNFRVDVSATTPDDAGFSTVVTAIALDNSTLQEFVFPAGPRDARYVRLVAVDAYGTGTSVSVNELQVVPVPTPVTSYSSYQDATNRPENLLDNSSSTYWLTASGQVTNQFVELDLGGETLLDRVRLQPSTFVTAENARDFDVLVSTTTDADAAFTKVLSATVANAGTLQEFLLPAPARARFVRLLVKNNYGSATLIRLATFEAVAVRSEGNIVTLPAAPVDVTGLESPSLIANGATVVAFSSQFDVNHSPANMLDYVAGNPWATRAPLLPGPHFVTIQLGGTALHNLVGIKISGRVDQAFTQSVRDFEVWVSSTTADDTAFTRVLTGTVVNDQSLQTFLFPGGAVPARYVKYVPKNNYGDPNNLSTSNFEVLTTTAGGVVSATTFSAYSNRPEFVLDGSSSTAAWRTRTGSVTNQSITLKLSGGTSHPLYGVSVWPEGGFGPKDYEIQVSNTTADDAAFTTVATGVLTSTDARREIPFNALTPATYVRFLWKTGLSTSFIGVRELEALEPPAAGAVVLAVSSENSTSFPVQRALDIDRISTGWITGNNLNTNQFVKILLPRAALWVVDHVALQGRDCCADQAPRDFDVQVSTTTFDDAAFTTVLSGTLRNDFSLQHFYFPPTPARAIRLLLKNAYGSTVIGVQTFWAFSSQLGGVNARFLDRSRAVDGALAGYDWDFGDGAHSSARDPEHLYAGPGIFNVALTVTDANGLTSTQTRSYQVFGAAAPDFTFSPTAASEGANVNFTDISPDPFGIGYREWAWGDGTANTVNTSPVGHVFADNGSYAVTLRVLNNRGLSAETTKTVTVSNVAPTVDAGPNQTVVWNQVWAISPSVNDAGTVDRNSLVCTWDFGDGQTAQVTACNSSNARVNHAYANPGTYTATLTVRDKENATASDFLTVTVNKRPTLLNIYAALSSTSAGAVEVAAKLVDRFDVTQAMPGQSVVFTLGTQTVPVTTNAEGIAVAVLTFAPGVVNTVTATYAGDTFYVPAADTDSFNPVSVFPETPSLRNDQSEIVALVPSDSGRVANGGVLSTVGFAGGYAPLILVVDPLVVADATKANPLPGFDTVALNGICDIGSNQFLGNATFRNRVQDFVVRGGKLVIWDSECQNTDYSKFFLPFTTNNPGALGANGTLQDVEENSLSSSDPASPAFVNVGFVSTQTDAVGDANVFLTFDPNWCVDMKAKNAVLPDFKPVHTYAVLGRGLLIYNGLDRDAMQSNASASPNTGSFFLARIWERELKQPWNPSGLPCDVAATQATIVLAPTSATLDVGQTHTVTATVTDVNGTPIRSVFVNLVVTGANPFTQQGTTNDSGVATFTYTGTHLGNDVLVAGAGAIQSNSASAHWNAAPIANAGDDQLVGTGSVVVLDGSRSSDPNPGDVLTYAWRQLSGPVVTLDDPASVHPRFTPTEAGDHVFELRVSDGRLSATDTVKITAEIRNRPPVAQDQAVATDEDVPLAIVLGATDPDGDALTYTLLSSPTHGTLTGSAPNLTYTPAGNYNGPDGFTFKATDALVSSNVATVSITVRPVNDAPVADDQAVATDEDTPLPIVLAASDIDGDVLVYAILTPPQHGTLTGAGASVTYTPAADYNGPDSFTFKVSDGSIDSNTATVAITVRPVNDAPVAQDQSLVVYEDSRLPILLTGSDVDGDTLTYAIVMPPAHGILTGTPPRLTYSPAADYNGPDSFTFTVHDGNLLSNVATIHILVRPLNDAPDAFDQSLVLDEDTTMPVVLSGSDVEGDPLTYAIVAAPLHGTLTGTGANHTYVPAANYNGPDRVTFKVNDGQADSNVATVTLTVRPVNDAPVASGQVLATDEDVPLPITLAAADLDGDALTYAVLAAPAHGTLTGTGASLTYKPAANYNGPDSFTFQVNDGHVDSNVATVGITVRPVNDAPVCSASRAVPDRLLWPPNHRFEPIAIQGVTDVEGNPLTIRATAIRQDETVLGAGSGDKSPDGILAPLQLRVERSGQGNGRVYHVTFEATDGQGGACTATVAVCVPHDQSGTTCVDGGPRYDSTKP